MLDIRILNADRNTENILVTQNALVPIDHGLSLSASPAVAEYDICWMTWPQCKEPLTKKCVEFINALDPFEDAKTLQSLGLPDATLKYARAAGILLKLGAQAGINLYEIGKILYRPGYGETASEFERLVHKAEAFYRSVHCGTTEDQPLCSHR